MDPYATLELYERERQDRLPEGLHLARQRIRRLLRWTLAASAMVAASTLLLVHL